MAPPQWAYQVENFVNEPDEELVCSICRAVFCEPVMCPCDHVFCRGCISKWLQNNRNCPICRKRASNSSVKQTVPIVKNLIMKLMLNCRNKAFGCKAQFSLESSEAHMKDCEYEFVQCKNKPCKDKLFRKDINEHETSDCPHRYIKCKTCASKMPTSAVNEKHDCIRSLLLRLRKKSILLRKRTNRIKELKNENKALKAAAQSSQRLTASSSTRNLGSLSSTLSSLSPDDITINIRELDSFSSSISSDSDSSENSIFNIIYTNNPLEQSDEDDAEFGSLSAYYNPLDQDNVEFSQNENAHDGNEFRNAESQTEEVDCNAESQTEDVDLTGGQQNNLNNIRGNNEIDGITTEVPESSRESERSQPRRPVKRRPTSDKPAKRKYKSANRNVSSCDEDSDNESIQPSSQSALRAWPKQLIEVDTRLRDASMEAGPSSAVDAVVSTNVSSNDSSVNTKSSFRPRGILNQRRSRRFTNSSSSNQSKGAGNDSTRGNAVFENTLSLLEQYNIESDPEWLPEYASHTGNTPSPVDSDSSNESITSSSSEHSDSENDVNVNPEDCEDDYLPDLSSLMQWNFDSSSEEEDDPNWSPYTFGL